MKRMEPQGGKSASMTRGHALLVMRYFGYLGLHSILKKKSSLARERLVDFTGELQVMETKKIKRGRNSKEKVPVLGETYTLPPWRHQYKVEQTSCGGRNATQPMTKLSVPDKDAPNNSSYAQEIAALPLEQAVPESSFRKGKTSQRRQYDGMLLHQSFCNELICQPKFLRRCSMKGIIIKVELRQLKFDEQLNAEIAIPVTPAAFHNTRRGPWLVQETYSSVAVGVPVFSDQFKMKLPLFLGAPGQERIGLLFSILSHSFHNDTKKKKRNRSAFRHSLEHVGAGFLPLTLSNSSTCLIPNGNYNVPIQFRASNLASAKDGSSPSSRRHRKRFSFGESIGGHFRSWSSSSETNEIRESTSEELMLTDEKYPEGSLALTRLRRKSVSHADEDIQEVTRSSDDVSLSDSKWSQLTDEIASTNESAVKSVSTASENEMVLQVSVIGTMFLLPPPFLGQPRFSQEPPFVNRLFL